MRAKLCNLRNSSAAAPPSDDDEYYNDERVDYSRWILCKLKPSCLTMKIEKHKKMICHHQESTREEDSTTLGEWLRNSPSIEMMETTGPYSWRLSPKVCDESRGLSIQGGTVTGDEPRRERAVLMSRRRSYSHGNTKMVRFTLPEEADIHLIHSHYDSEECEVCNQWCV